MYKDHKLSILRCTFTFLLRAAKAFVGPFTKIIEASALLMLHGECRESGPRKCAACAGKDYECANNRE
jgi:hypothetical protein